MVEIRPLPCAREDKVVEDSYFGMEQEGIGSIDGKLSKLESELNKLDEKAETSNLNNLELARYNAI